MKKILIVMLLMISIFGVSASDVADFVNLGFSEDSSYFMFSEYGQDIENGKVYANAYIIDVKKNDYASEGTNYKTYKHAISAGQSSQGAVYNLVREWNSTISKYNIDNLNSGRIIYTLHNGQAVKDDITYRDFSTGNSYAVELNQMVFDKDANLESTFYLSVSITDASGKTVSKVAGHPDFRRKNVSKYFIKEAILAPNSKYLVVVLGKEIKTDDGGIDVRYMVETLEN